MGQNNDNTEHGDLQGQQGVIKGQQKSAILVPPGTRAASSLPNADGEDAPNGIPLPDRKR